MQKTEITDVTTDETISKYYDGEMGDLELVNFEAQMALSEKLYKKCADECYKNFKISNSIKLVKIRQDAKAQRSFEEFEKNYDRLIVNLNAVSFKSFYECLRNRFLNILGNNP